MATQTTANLTPLQRFFRLLKVDKRQIGNIYIYAIVGGVVNLSLPLGVQAVINLLGSGQVSTSLNVLVLLVIIGMGLAGALQVLQLVISEMLQRKIFTRAAFEFAYRIPRLQGDTQRSHYVPELINRFFDTLSVQKGLSKILLDFSAAALQAVFGLLLLSLYHPFFIIFSLLIVLLVALIFRLSGPRGLDTSITESKYKYAVVHWLEEVARALESFKLAGHSPLPMKRTNTLVNGYLDSREKHFAVLKVQYISLIAFKVLVAAGLLILGGMLVLEQEMNIGQFVAAEIIIILVMNSVEKLVLSMETIYDVLTSLEKLGNVTDLPLENHKGSQVEETLSNNKGLAVTFKKVNLYEHNHQAILQDLNFQLKEGEKVALVGAPNSGRTILLRSLAGLHNQYSGTITFNQLPLRSLNLESLRSALGANLERHGIFAGSLMDNIRLKDESLPLERVQEILKVVGLEEFVMNLSEGLDTVMLPEGRHLSESIIGKILLARALAANPRLLLLEDVFFRLEQPAVKRLMEYLLSKDQPWTLVASLRKPELAEYFDKVLLLHDHGLEVIDQPEKLREHFAFNSIF